MLILALLYVISLQVIVSLTILPYYPQLFTASYNTVVAVLPLLYLSALIVHWLYSRRRFGGQLVRALQALRLGTRY